MEILISILAICLIALVIGSILGAFILFRVVIKMFKDLFDPPISKPKHKTFH